MSADPIGKDRRSDGVRDEAFKIPEQVCASDVSLLKDLKLFWLSYPNPKTPTWVRDVAVCLHLVDVPLGALWVSLLGQRVTGVLSILRVVCHGVGFKMTGSDELKSVIAVATMVAFSLASRILSKLSRSRKPTWTQKGFRMLGNMQLFSWILCHQETLLGVILRSTWHFSRMCFARLAPKVGLEGTFLFPKREFPTCGAEVSVGWISHQLLPDPAFKNTEAIKSIEIHQLSGGIIDTNDSKTQGYMAECVRVKLELENLKGQKHVQTPTSVVAKFPSRSFQRTAKLRNLGLYYREVRFYQQIAPKLIKWKDDSPMLSVPHTYASGYDDRAGDFILLMEDAGHMNTGDELKGANWQQACSVALRYARFHSLHWSKDEKILDKEHNMEWHRCFDWMAIHPLLTNKVVRTALRELMETERFARLVNPKVQNALHLLSNNMELVLNELRKSPMTIVHADCRMENMLWPSNSAGAREDTLCTSALSFDASHEVQRTRWLSVDWQTSTKNVGIYDISYFATLDLNIDPSAGPHCDLILCEAYYNEVARCINLRKSDQEGHEPGIQGYTQEQCWTDYRLSVLLASLIPVAVMRSENIGDDARGANVREAMLRRAVQAVARVDAGSVIEDLVDRNSVRRVMSGSLTSYRQMEDKMLTNERESEDGVLVFRNACPKDEEFSHITPEVLAALRPGTDVGFGEGRRDTYDRWFLNGFHAESKVQFALAFGLYPGRRVVDASFSITRNGTQHNLRASRKLSEGEWPTNASSMEVIQVASEVGPIKITVLKPLQVVQVDVSVPNTISASLKFEARYSPSMEPPYTNTIPNIGKFHYDRLTQLVRWNGEIRLYKESIQVRQWYGVRDRSWGTRPHNVADQSKTVSSIRHAAIGNQFLRDCLLNPIFQKSSKTPQFYWFWSPIHFATGGILYHSQQDAVGNVTNGAAKIVGDPFNLEDPSSQIKYEPYGRVEAAGHSVQYIPGTRHAKSLTIVLALQDGRRITVLCEPIGLPFFMSGVGYNHTHWTHGTSNHLENALMATQIDSYVSNVTDRNHPNFWHVQELCKVTAKLYATEAAPNDKPIALSIGSSAVEQLVIGPHRPSSFKSLYDT